MFYYGFDMTYVVLVLPAMIFAMWAQFNVQSTFKKYTRIPSERGMTGRDAARLILDRNGLYNVKIEQVAGELTDHFDPKAGVIRLSSSTYNVQSAAAVGVAAHEAGHAVQHAEGYGPIKLREAIIPVTQLGSKLAIPLVILGIILSFYPLAYAGIILFGAVTVFQLVTLPVEFNASSRAVEALDASGTLSGDGLAASKKVLRAAALTYVAALFVSLANLLRLVIMVSGRGRRD
ncbi:MAG: zinc metallopeptidase [Clostridia bacterium]|nr:zinc metallopeptidase [Clostridia bacterium]